MVQEIKTKKLLCGVVCYRDEKGDLTGETSRIYRECEVDGDGLSEGEKRLIDCMMFERMYKAFAEYKRKAAKIQ